MKASAVSLVAIGLLGWQSLSAQPPDAPSPPCVPAADTVCGQQGPEDIVALGPKWVVASAYIGTGGVSFIRVSDRTPHTGYPNATAKHRHDTKTYPDCPGPPVADKFTTHGVYVVPGDGPVHKLFVVGHGARESVEIFEVDTTPAMPAVTWLGCVIAPDPIGLNAVRALPDGGFFTTNFLPRGDPQGMRRMRGGEKNGELWEWHTTTGWEKIPGSEAAGANGIELSDDGKTLYMAAWGSQSFVRFSLDQTPPKREEIPLGFLVDNIHWAADGTLWATGQADKNWKSVKINPDTLEVREIVNIPDTPEFGGGTVVLEIGDKLWVGSYRGNRLAIIPAP